MSLLLILANRYPSECCTATAKRKRSRVTINCKEGQTVSAVTIDDSPMVTHRLVFVPERGRLSDHPLANERRENGTVRLPSSEQTWMRIGTGDKGQQLPCWVTCSTRLLNHTRICQLLNTLTATIINNETHLRMRQNHSYSELFINMTDSNRQKKRKKLINRGTQTMSVGRLQMSQGKEVK